MGARVQQAPLTQPCWSVVMRNTELPCLMSSTTDLSAGRPDGAATGINAEGGLEFFEPEAEFRKETIHFIGIDRFLNGNLQNDGVAKKELDDPTRRHCSSRSWLDSGLYILRARIWN